MKLRNVIEFTTLLVLVTAHLAPGASRAAPRDDERQAAIVEQICADLERVYVSTKDAEAMAELLQTNLQRGAYDDIFFRGGLCCALDGGSAFGSR